MKERFWSVYYWLMISYLFLALITIVEYHNTYKLVEATHYQTNLKCEAHNKRMLEITNRKYEAYKQQLKDSGEDFIGLPPQINYWDCEPGTKVKSLLPVSNVSDFSNRNLFFNFIGYQRNVVYFYPFILIFFMTLIRWIFIGKHIWQRP